MAPTPLQQLIIEHIQREGPITFADYMRMALYEPDYGYYVTGSAKMGWDGDYYTSTDLSDFFAHCVGRQLYQMWEQLGYPTPFLVLEQGAGRGHLAEGIRSWAAQEFPAFHTALDYHNEDIRTGQNAQITPIIPLEEEANVTASGQKAYLPYSVILSNELVDAFPVHIVEVRDKQLYEVYIDVQHDRLSEVLAEPGSPAVANYLDDYKIPWATFDNGWRAEINLDALHWMEHTAHLLPSHASHTRKKHGFILTVDYGEKAHALYTRSRHYGTLTCYFQHQLTDRPLVRPGEQDITAHVNFTALINEGRRQGLRLQKFTTQQLWLTGLGINEELERLRMRDFAVIDSARASDRGQVALLQWHNLRQRIAALTNPAGMGNFKVLILAR